jgi:hypothetical protein
MVDKKFKFNLGGSINTAVSGGSGGVIGGSIQLNQVAYGTGVDTIGGENVFTYDPATNTLTVDNLKTNTFEMNSNYFLPTSDGTSGQVLTTNGAGTVTFQDASSAMVTINADFGESILGGHLVRYLQNGETGTLGTVVQANASEIQSRDVFVARYGGGIGSNEPIVVTGTIGVRFTTTILSTDIGKTVYLSTTDGLATLTPPSTSGDLVIQLGTLVSLIGTGITVANIVFRPQFIVQIG